MAGSSSGPTSKLQAALREFESILSAEEKRQLHGIKSIPDADSAIQFTARLDRANFERKGASLGSRVYSTMQSVQQFSNVVGSFVSSHPDIAALVWGSVQMAMLVAANFTSYFQELSLALRDFGRWCPRFHEYSLLYPLSVALQGSICDFHALLIQCCAKIVLVTKRPWHAHLVNSLTTSFQAEVQGHIAKLREQSILVNFEIHLAKAQVDKNEHELQKSEREAASKHRDLLQVVLGSAKKEFAESQQWRARIDKFREDKKKQDLLDLISVLDTTNTYKQARAKRYSSTATWLVQSTEFLRWANDDSCNMIYLSGKIGSGKTVLAASVIDTLSIAKSSSEAVFFFFVRFDNQQSLQAENILRSIIRQWMLTSQMSAKFTEAVESASNTCWPRSKLIELLKLRFDGFSKCSVVIDAVDECDPHERHVLFEVLKNVVEACTSKVKLMIVGRSMAADITRYFPSFEQVSMERAPVTRDLETYARQCVQERYQQGLLRMRDESLLDYISTILTQRAQGMFLWVALEIDEICSQVCEEDIILALENLPVGLTEVFQRSLRRIVDQKNTKIAQGVFQWVTVAKRPLTLDELQQALSIRVGDSAIVPERWVTGVERVSDWCANLIEVDDTTCEVQLIHHTVRQFLLDTSAAILSEPSAAHFHMEAEENETRVAELCMTYLDLEDLKMTLVKSEERPGRLNLSDAKVMAQTALSNKWNVGRLARQSTPSSYQITLPSDLMAKFDLIARRRQFDPHKNIYPLKSYAQEHWLAHSSSISSASFVYNLWCYMIAGSHGLAQTPWTQKQFRDRDIFVINWAAKHLHKALLRHTFGVFEFEARDIWPSVVAMDDIDLLHKFVLAIEEAASVECVTDFFLRYPRALTPFYWSDQFQRISGYPVLIQTLFAACIEQGTALPLGALLKLYPDLLRHHVNSLDILNKAIKSRSLEVFHLLTDGGRLIGGCLIDDSESILHFAVRSCWVELLEQLLEQDTVDINCLSRNRRTPLYLAAYNEDTTMARLLLEHGALPSIQTDWGWTALHLAASLGNKPMINLLCQFHTPIDVRSVSNSTALYLAISYQCPESTLTLLRNGAGVSLEHVHEARIMASKMKNQEITKYLADLKIDKHQPHARNNSEDTDEGSPRPTDAGEGEHPPERAYDTWGLNTEVLDEDFPEYGRASRANEEHPPAETTSNDADEDGLGPLDGGERKYPQVGGIKVTHDIEVNYDKSYANPPMNAGGI